SRESCDRPGGGGHGWPGSNAATRTARRTSRSSARRSEPPSTEGETIGAAFDRIVGQAPDNDALVVRHHGVRWTYAELKARVDAFAAGLVALGLERGDRLGIWSPNNSPPGACSAHATGPWPSVPSPLTGLRSGAASASASVQRPVCAR